MNLMQLPDEYQNDPQGGDNKEEENKNYEEEHYQILEKIFSVNSYFYHSFLISKINISQIF